MIWQVILLFFIGLQTCHGFDRTCTQEGQCIHSFGLGSKPAARFEDSVQSFYQASSKCLFQHRGLLLHVQSQGGMHRLQLPGRRRHLLLLPGLPGTVNWHLRALRFRQLGRLWCLLRPRWINVKNAEGTGWDKGFNLGVSAWASLVLIPLFDRTTHSCGSGSSSPWNNLL